MSQLRKTKTEGEGATFARASIIVRCDLEDIHQPREANSLSCCLKMLLGRLGLQRSLKCLMSLMKHLQSSFNDEELSVEIVIEERSCWAAILEEEFAINAASSCFKAFER
jgi:hypothetical protein